MVVEIFGPLVGTTGTIPRRQEMSMRRRDVMKLLGAVAAWPLAARAQQPARPVVGFLGSTSQQPFASFVTAFAQGLRDAGFVEGQNLAIEYRWAAGQFERLPALASELVRQPVDVLATGGGNVSARAAKAATSTIPIVFVTADDPVASGLVASLNRPGGNMTGVTWLGSELLAKNLELVHELLPTVSVIGVLVNPKRQTADVQLRSAQDAANALGKAIRILHASTERDIDTAFETVASERIGALLIATDPVFITQRRQVVTLAARHAVPTVYFLRDHVSAAGLMSYGASVADAFKLSGGYVGRILKGAKPADLPVQQSTKVELTLNLKTAKSLGLTFPLTLLGRADEMIE